MNRTANKALAAGMYKTYRGIFARIWLMFFWLLIHHGPSDAQEGNILMNTDWEHERHAWGSSPSYHFLALVCGVTPAEQGFKSVMVAPRLGDLTYVKASVPHPLGQIVLDIRRSEDEGIRGTVILPDALYGTFNWKGESIPLRPGKQKLHL